MVATKVNGNNIVELIDTLSRSFCRYFQEDQENTKSAEQQTQVDSLLKRNKSWLDRAFVSINDFFQQQKKLDEPINTQQIIDEIDIANGKAKSLLGNEATLQEKLSETGSIAALLGLSERTLYNLYQMAYTLFDEGEVQEAHDLFWLLSSLDAYSPPYWLGVGMTAQRLGRYDEALHAMGMAISLDPENPLPYFASAECHIQRKESQEAHNHLDLCLECCANDPQWSELRKKTQELKKNLH